MRVSRRVPDCGLDSFGQVITVNTFEADIFFEQGNQPVEVTVLVEQRVVEQQPRLGHRRILGHERHFAQARGALVGVVNDKGPAKTAGIKSGDVIVRFDGKNVPDSATLPKIVAATAGDKAMKPP